MGREYTLPVEGIGKGFKDEICLLMWFYWCCGCITGLGASFGLSVCNNLGINCAACYSCHAREKLRRKYKLPPTFGLPPGFDDCCVHFCCSYCSSHQELRELTLRGVDGPGISPLDVNPESWAHLPGFQEEMAHRKKKLKFIQETGLTQPFLPFEQRMTRDHPNWQRMKQVEIAQTALTTKSVQLQLQKDAAGVPRAQPPAADKPDVNLAALEDDESGGTHGGQTTRPKLQRAWSVAY
jgi:Cys-rich protein (TIGR01571 family)